MKLNSSKSASKSRVRFPIIITSILTLIFTVISIPKFPDFLDRMQRAVENTEINGALNEHGTTSSYELLLIMGSIVISICLWIYLIRQVNNYKRLYLRADRQLLDSKQYSKLFRTWLNE